MALYCRPEDLAAMLYACLNSTRTGSAAGHVVITIYNMMQLRLMAAVL
jgi:hypothetical protein